MCFLEIFQCEFDRDRCEKIKVETQREMSETGLKISPQFIALCESFAVEFIKICRYKTFWMRTLYVESSCCLDVAVYMLNCVFW